MHVMYIEAHSVYAYRSCLELFIYSCNLSKLLFNEMPYIPPCITGLEATLRAYHFTQLSAWLRIQLTCESQLISLVHKLMQNHATSSLTLS